MRKQRIKISVSSRHACRDATVKLPVSRFSKGGNSHPSPSSPSLNSSNLDYICYSAKRNRVNRCHDGRGWSGAKYRGCNSRGVPGEWQVNQAYNWNSIRTVAQIHDIRIPLAALYASCLRRARTRVLTRRLRTKVRTTGDPSWNVSSSAAATNRRPISRRGERRNAPINQESRFHDRKSRFDTAEYKRELSMSTSARTWFRQDSNHLSIIISRPITIFGPLIILKRWTQR